MARRKVVRKVKLRNDSLLEETQTMPLQALVEPKSAMIPRDNNRNKGLIDNAP
jgi:hypothetical protein